MTDHPHLLDGMQGRGLGKVVKGNARIGEQVQVDRARRTDQLHRQLNNLAKRLASAADDLQPAT